MPAYFFRLILCCLLGAAVFAPPAGPAQADETTQTLTRFFQGKSRDLPAAPIDFQTRFVTVLQRPHSLQPLPAHPPARVQRPVPPDPGRDQLPRRATEPLPSGPVSPGRSGVSPGKLLPESGR